MNINFKLVVFSMVFSVLGFAVLGVSAVHAASNVCASDLDANGFVDLSDYHVLVSDFLKTSPANAKADINQDGIVDISDYAIMVKVYLQSCSTSTNNDVGAWTQDAHDAQRTGGTAEEPTTPWTFAWMWNGSDANGGIGGHTYDAPTEARTVVGGGNLYAPAGSKGLYALNLVTGTQAWNLTTTTFNAAPSYDSFTGDVYAGGTDGKIYKIDPASGNVLKTYSTGSPINKALLIVGNFVYAVNDSGQLHKVNTGTMAMAWVYSGNSRADTPPSYSSTRDCLVFASADLYVHAVNNNNGSQKWHVKPSPNTAGFPNTFDQGWPVIADQHGIVFVRMQLSHDSMTAYPSSDRSFPSTMDAIRSWLVANPQYQNLYALNLDNGSVKFVPAVGYGSTESYINGRTYGVMGGQPVVKVWPDGTEVVYMFFRSNQGGIPDYRWDGHLGEMVLDNNTISGMQAGDLRYIKGFGYSYIIDEQTPLTILGQTLVNSHWSGPESAKITNRANTLGTNANPIQIQPGPIVIRAITGCDSSLRTSNHYTTCGSGSYVTDGGGRWLGGPSFWVYWGVADPPGWRVGSGNTAGTSYSAGSQPRYMYSSNGFVVIEGNGGDIMVLKHS